MSSKRKNVENHEVFNKREKNINYTPTNILKNDIKITDQSA